MGDGIVDFAFIEPRDPPHKLLFEPFTMEEAMFAIQSTYERPVATLKLEADLPKKRSREVYIEPPTIPQGKPRTVFKEKMAGLLGGKGKIARKGVGWTATDPAWRIVVGTGRTRYSAEHSLRVQVAAVAWRRMGGKIGCNSGTPLPCKLTKLGKVWTATSWREGVEGELAVGLTIEEALKSLVVVRGGIPKLSRSVVEWREAALLHVFEEKPVGWYGGDPL